MKRKSNGWGQSFYFGKTKNGNSHRYYPDFYLPEFNIYLDPKNDYLINYPSKRFGITDVEKICTVAEQNKVKIIILSKLQINWEYVKTLLS